MRNLSARWLDSAPAHLAGLVTVTVRVKGSAARRPWGCLLVSTRRPGGRTRVSVPPALLQGQLSSAGAPHLPEERPRVFP